MPRQKQGGVDQDQQHHKEEQISITRRRAGKIKYEMQPEPEEKVVVDQDPQ